MTAAAAQEEMGSGPRRATFARVVLGFVAAVLAPSMLIVLLLLFYKMPDVMGELDPAVLRAWTKVGLNTTYAVGAIMAIVTVPVAVILGLPAIALFLLLGWRDWPRHAAAGVLIGGIAGFLLAWAVVSQGPDVNRLTDSLAAGGFFAAFGVVSTTAYWIAVHGRVRLLRMSLGLASLLFLAFLVLKFVSIRAGVTGGF